MNTYGIRFRVNDAKRFDQLRYFFYELKKDKDAKTFRGLDKWAQLIPAEVKGKFHWSALEMQKIWSERKKSAPILFDDPSEYLGLTWRFHRVIDGIESSRYALLACESTSPAAAEMRIDPWIYPYGGVGPLIALAEAFGFEILGVNEFGKYQTREELKMPQPIHIAQAKPEQKPRWKFW